MRHMAVDEATNSYGRHWEDSLHYGCSCSCVVQTMFISGCLISQTEISEIAYQLR